VRSPQYRTVLVEGALGVWTHNQMLRMVVYNEARSVEQVIDHKVAKDGSLGDMVVPAGADETINITRELEASLLMSPSTALLIHAWLGQRIEELKQMAAASTTRAKK